MKFDTSSETHEFIETVYPRVGARNQAVLGRSALCLALAEGVPADFKIKDSKGVTLNDEQVLGDDLKDLVRASLNFRAGRTLDDPGYRAEFRRHFEFGCYRLKQIWEGSGKDQARFVASLLKLPGVSVGEPNGQVEASHPVIEDEVRLKILVDHPEWSMNGPGTKNGLLVISGEPGSGKSQLALDLLMQISRQGVKFVFFDLKGELEEDTSNQLQSANRNRFLHETKAKYIRLIDDSLPINPLLTYFDPTTTAQAAYEIAHLIKCFAPQLGVKQEKNLVDAYQRIANPDFESLARELESSGANGVELALIQKICRFEIFSTSQASVSVDDWLQNSIIIDFKALGNDSETKSIVVALTLNLLMKRLNRNLPVQNGVQPLKMVLFVDEAHLLLPKEGKAGLLGSLARQGRSWGFPVWLASQDADAFQTTGQHATDFAELAEGGIHFSPQILSGSQQKAILGTTFKSHLAKSEAVLRTQSSIKSGPARQFWRDGGK